MKRLTVGRKISLGFLAVILAAAALGVFAVIELRGIHRQAALMARESMPNIQLLANVRSEAQINFIQSLEHVMAHDAAAKTRLDDQIRQRVASISAMLDTYRASLYGEDIALFERMLPLRKTYVTAFTEGLDLSRQEKLDEARARFADRVQPAFEAFMSGINELAKMEMDDGNLASTQIERSVASATQAVVIGLLIAVAIGITVAWIIGRGITRPLQAAAALVHQVAARDLTARVNATSRDEIGDMCDALNEMVAGLRDNMRSVSENAQALSAASTELSAVSSQVSSNSEETSTQANVVASAAEQVSKSVATAATASEEMSASIKEIAQQASEAARVATQAAESASRTNGTILKLGSSSAEIGNVIKVISSIAEQTNLFALNATIEAARAGDAGRGFAVVAGEVKELAKQTAAATEEIRTKIEGIQGDTRAAVAAIKEITEVIQRINQIQTIIASSVEEQAATMNEIANNSSEASRGTSEIAQNINSVSTAARSSTEGASQTASAAEELSRLSEQLSAVVAQFKLSDGLSSVDPETRPLVGLARARSTGPAVPVRA